MKPAVVHALTHLQLNTTRQVQTQAQIVSLHAMLGIIFLGVPVSSAHRVSTHLEMSLAAVHARTNLPLDTTHPVELQA